MKVEQTECSETSAYKIQTPGNYPEENIQHSEHGESLTSRILYSSWYKKLAKIVILELKIKHMPLRHGIG